VKNDLRINTLILLPTTAYTMAAHQRKIELQSPADLTYLYANTVALSRRKLDLYFPPSATNDETPDPMRERVRELVDDVSRTNLEPENGREKT